MVGQSISQSTAPSSSTPILRAVLASLDIQMDEELARYRRHRLMQRRSRPQRPPNPASSPATSAPSLGSAPAMGLPAAAASYTQVPELVPSPWDDPETVAIAPRVQPQATSESATANEVVAASLPDDYLESSEYLLYSLGEESPAADADEPSDRLLDVLLTPLGIGALLLLLVSSAMVGFLMVNPSILGIERWGQLFRQDTPDDSENLSDQSNLPSRPYPDLSADEFVDLNLDTLSTLRNRAPFLAPTASKPSPSPSASPSTSPSPAASTNGTTPLSVSPVGPIAAAPSIITTRDLPNSTAPAAPAPPTNETAEPSAPAVIPEVAPEPVAVAPAHVEPAPPPAAEASAPGEYVYVITDYSGDRSLEDAQSVVGDAYVRNFDDGAQVQLGAFSSAERAQELISELEQQGISAEMYQP